MSNRLRISKLYSSFQICWGAFLKRWLQSSRIFSYFYLIDDCAYRVARELGASAKQETWQETWVRLARLARPPHPSRLPSRSLFFFFFRARWKIEGLWTGYCHVKSDDGSHLTRYLGTGPPTVSFWTWYWVFPFSNRSDYSSEALVKPTNFDHKPK